jgi:hypothetical protein
LAIVLLQAASLIHARIEQVRDEPWTYHDRRVRLCGEVTEDRSTLYSDTSSHFHGRVGVKLSGHGVSGRNQCVTGYVRRVDGKGREKASQELEVTDAPVRADYVFVAEQAGSS